MIWVAAKANFTETANVPWQQNMSIYKLFRPDKYDAKYVDCNTFVRSHVCNSTTFDTLGSTLTTSH